MTPGRKNLQTFDRGLAILGLVWIRAKKSSNHLPTSHRRTTVLSPKFDHMIMYKTLLRENIFRRLSALTRGVDYFETRLEHDVLFIKNSC